MKVLIDECLPRALKRLFTGHECRTVQELLSVAEREFDVLVTIDHGIQHRQSLAGRSRRSREYRFGTRSLGRRRSREIEPLRLATQS
jgi:hypothetical protein